MNAIVLHRQRIVDLGDGYGDEEEEEDNDGDDGEEDDNEHGPLGASSSSCSSSSSSLRPWFAPSKEAGATPEKLRAWESLRCVCVCSFGQT